MTGITTMESDLAALPVDSMSDEAFFDETARGRGGLPNLEGCLDLPPRLVSLDRDEDLDRLDPSTRIERLLANMQPYKRTLLLVVASCKEASSYDQIARLLEDAQRGARSVYMADNFLNMLVDAGAIEVLTAEGEPYVRSRVEPQTIECAGKIFLKVTAPPKVFWRATQAGLEALAHNDPIAEIEKLFCGRDNLKPSFALLLRLCSQENGADIKVLKESINERPEMVESKKTAQFLIDYLLDAGAIYYDADCRAWRTNEIGIAAMSILASDGE